MKASNTFEPYIGKEETVVNDMNRIENCSNSNISEELAKLMEGEPDFADVKMKEYHIVVWRVPDMLCLNGYVGVKRTHPYFGLERHARRVGEMKVHGGITFTGKRQLPGFKKGFWYFGFDTGHAFDLVPGIENDMVPIMEMFMSSVFGVTNDRLGESVMNAFKNRPRTYKDVSYISKETEKLYTFLHQVKERQQHYRYSPVREYRKLAKLKRQNAIAIQYS